MSARSDSASLTIKELHVLLALSLRPMAGYDIVRTCEQDTSGLLSLSNGTVYPACKRLEEAGLIRRSKGDGVRNPGRQKVLYELTGVGRKVLGWETAMYRHVVDLAKERLQR